MKSLLRFELETKRKQRNKVGGSNERCLLMSSFDAKTSRSEVERAIDCHTVHPVKQYENPIFKGVTQTGKTLFKNHLHFAKDLSLALKN